MLRNFALQAALILVSSTAVRADVTLLLEEPYGNFGGMNPTGHSAVYFSRICAASPTVLRRCQPGETGAVVSRYHRVGGYDWLAIPLVAYLYAVDRPEDIPTSATREEAASFRDEYRRRHLEDIVPDAADGATPEGDWTQLVGEAYDRTLYGFTIETTQQQDDALIARLNSAPNHVKFHLLYRNCADFVRNIIDDYYPGAVHRSFTADVGIMTPKQAAKSLVHYSKRNSDLEFSTFIIPQVSGDTPRSSPVKGVLESLIKSKKYAVPVIALAAFHPYVGAPLVIACLRGSGFNPEKVAKEDEGTGLRSTIMTRAQQAGRDEP